MKTQVILLFLFVTLVSAGVLFHQPISKAVHEHLSKRQAGDEVLINEPSSSGVTAPRTFDGPTVSGFNFDSFAADDFINDEIWSIDEIDIKIAVNQLTRYDISRVFVAIYPDEGRGLPDYHPYDRLNPEPEWYSWYTWQSDNPNIDYDDPWLDNPVRAAAIRVNTTGLISLKPGHWWLTMHFEILTSQISIPPASWLPGDTDLYQHKPARLYLPGNNPASTSNNAFGWFWNDLENFGIGALAFSLVGRSTNFLIEVDDFPIRCPGDLRVETVATVSFPDGDSQDIEVSATGPEELDIWFDYTILNSTFPSTGIYVRGFTAGNEYPITLVFEADGAITWEEELTIRAVNDHLFPPELIVRDEYGLVGGLFQWTPTSMPEFYQIQIVSEDNTEFTDPEFNVFTTGSSYRTKLTDWAEGTINNFESRDQGNYNLRIRAVNPSCPDTTASEWSETLSFESDACEVWNVELPDETYNFEKGQFVSSSFKTSTQGTITDVRLRIQGFHHKWSDVAIAIKTPVVYLGTPITIPQFSDGCDEDFDSGNFDIRFVLDASKEVEDICPPPQAGESYNDTLIDPIGGGIFEDYVRGQNKRGTWYVQWLDRGIGFPTNGKITGFDLLLCAVPVPPREHIIYKGESKIKEGTIGVYGS